MAFYNQIVKNLADSTAGVSIQGDHATGSAIIINIIGIILGCWYLLSVTVFPDASKPNSERSVMVWFGICMLRSWHVRYIDVSMAVKRPFLIWMPTA